jgi:hypothetical protein
MLYLVLTTVAAHAACHANWNCVTRFDGTITNNLDDFGVGAGILADSTANDVWFVMNRNVEITNGVAWQNQVWGGRWSCDDATCSTVTELTAWTRLNDGGNRHTRTAGQNANTGPSVTMDHGFDNRVHIAAMEDDPNCSSGAQLARYREAKWNASFSSLIANSAIDSDAGSPVCDDEWNHGQIQWNPFPTMWFAGWTHKIGSNEDVQFNRRDEGSSTWSAPEDVVNATSSDHIAQAVNDVGDEFFAYHDKGSSLLVFGDGSFELDLSGTNGADWPALVFDSAPSPDEFHLMFADDVSGDPVVATTSCAYSDCFTTWDVPSTVWAMTEATATNVRAIDYQLSADGTEHILWITLRTGDDGVFYSRRCPGGSWTGPDEVYTNTSRDMDLDVGRPHMAFTEVSGSHVVHLSFADQSATDSDIIWARQSWTCS